MNFWWQRQNKSTSNKNENLSKSLGQTHTIRETLSKYTITKVNDIAEKINQPHAERDEETIHTEYMKPGGERYT